MGQVAASSIPIWAAKEVRLIQPWFNLLQPCRDCFTSTFDEVPAAPVAFACSAHAETTSLPTLTVQKSWFMIWLDPTITGKQIILDIPIDMFPNVSPCFFPYPVFPRAIFFCWAWRVSPLIPRHGAYPPAANMSPAFEVPGRLGGPLKGGGTGWLNMGRYWW